MRNDILKSVWQTVPLGSIVNLYPLFKRIDNILFLCDMGDIDYSVSYSLEGLGSVEITVPITEMVCVTLRIFKRDDNPTIINMMEIEYGGIVCGNEFFYDKFISCLNFVNEAHRKLSGNKDIKSVIFTINHHIDKLLFKRYEENQ